MLVMNFVDADGIVSRPLAVVQALAKGKSSLVKCGSNWQENLLERRSNRVSTMYFSERRIICRRTTPQQGDWKSIPSIAKDKRSACGYNVHSLPTVIMTSHWSVILHW